MAIVAWQIGSVIHTWNARSGDARQFTYEILQKLEGIDFPSPEEGDEFLLRMYSSMETRWLVVQSFPVISSEWPYIDVNRVMGDRESLWSEVRQHAQGYRDEVQRLREVGA